MEDDFRMNIALKNISNAGENFSGSPSKLCNISPVKVSPHGLLKKQNKRSSTKKHVRKENDAENSPMKK